MNTAQAGITAPVPKLSRHLMFSIRPGAEVKSALSTLATAVDGQTVVAGIGRNSVLAMNKNLPGLKPFPVFEQARVELPATPHALWLWLRGDDRGALYHHSQQLCTLLAGAYQAEFVMDTFQYGASLDMTGYVDGTENPTGDDALAAAFVQDAEPGMQGSSFVAVQQWLHHLDYFNTLPEPQRDNIIGRRHSDNEELADAPITAHVKRTAQEDFNPPAFVLRRSMPWATGLQAGLMFVAFGATLNAFEAQLKRMSGAEDGQLDALFSFSKPLTGSYFWCPPMKDGGLDLSGLGI